MLFDPNWTPKKTDIELKPWQTLLLRAADVLERRGWTQNAYSRNGRVCALGAINVAAGGRPAQQQFESDIQAAVDCAEDHLIKYACRVYGFSSIPSWNDSLRSKEGKRIVIAVMREIAAKRFRT